MFKFIILVVEIVYLFVLYLFSCCSRSLYQLDDFEPAASLFTDGFVSTVTLKCASHPQISTCEPSMTELRSSLDVD